MLIVCDKITIQGVIGQINMMNQLAKAENGMIDQIV